MGKTKPHNSKPSLQISRPIFEPRTLFSTHGTPRTPLGGGSFLGPSISAIYHTGRRGGCRTTDWSVVRRLLSQPSTSFMDLTYAYRSRLKPHRYFVFLIPLADPPTDSPAWPRSQPSPAAASSPVPPSGGLPGVKPLRHLRWRWRRRVRPASRHWRPSAGAGDGGGHRRARRRSRGWGGTGGNGGRAAPLSSPSGRAPGSSSVAAEEAPTRPPATHPRACRCCSPSSSPPLQSPPSPIPPRSPGELVNPSYLLSFGFRYKVVVWGVVCRSVIRVLVLSLVLNVFAVGFMWLHNYDHEVRIEAKLLICMHFLDVRVKGCKLKPEEWIHASLSFKINLFIFLILKLSWVVIFEIIMEGFLFSIWYCSDYRNALNLAFGK